uniref:Uncharacterized protein n=1 Tax=Pygocentrus nattereri TaxID=42514 RepID=A0AAR2J8D9_PYGNA
MAIYSRSADVLAQEHGGNYRPVAYLSKTLDLVIQCMPACLGAVAACALMVSDAEKLAFMYKAKMFGCCKGFVKAKQDCPGLVGERRWSL